jgi:hypothetical protein
MVQDRVSEHDNESCDSIKGGEFLDHLRGHHLSILFHTVSCNAHSYRMLQQDSREICTNWTIGIRFLTGGMDFWNEAPCSDRIWNFLPGNNVSGT